MYTDKQIKKCAAVFNKKTRMIDVLRKHGYTIGSEFSDGSIAVTRPNKNPADGRSGTITANGNYHSFSANDIVPGNETYSPYEFVKAVEFNGDDQRMTDAHKEFLTETNPMTTTPLFRKPMPPTLKSVTQIQRDPADIIVLLRCTAEQIDEMRGLYPSSFAAMPDGTIAATWKLAYDDDGTEMSETERNEIALDLQHWITGNYSAELSAQGDKTFRLSRTGTSITTPIYAPREMRGFSEYIRAKIAAMPF